MLDLPAFYTRHHTRLRKWLPKNIHVASVELGGWFYRRGVGMSFSLTSEEASIFLEHAARRVVDAEWLRVDGIARFYLGWTLEDFILELDTLFPEEKNENSN